MAAVVELLIAADAFDLGRVTKVAADVHLELERVVPTGEDIMPFFWATGEDFEAFERAVRAEALVSAVERGYFEVPRGVTLGDIADDLGISQQAASERVRRGTNTVLRTVLLSRSAGDLPADD